MKQVEEEYKKLMDEIEASKERIESETSWKSRCEELAKINKEHQKLNGKLRKENDGLITVIHLARNYIKHPIFSYDEKKPADILFDVLEILESVEE
jgi:hypothetical protein